MSKNLRIVVLHLLEKSSDPMSLSELKLSLNGKINDKTLQRLLNELVKENLVRKSGQTKGTKYTAVKDELPSDVRAVSANRFGVESSKTIKKVNRPLFERSPVTYNPEWLDSYKPNTTFYLPATIRKELQKAGKRANNHDAAGTYAHQIFNRLLIDLSYNSSRLEGNTYSLLDTERLLLHGDSAEGKLDEEKTMILNHKEAIRYLVDNASKIKINESVICTLHFLLSEGLVEARYAGKVRDYSVRIGGSTYVPFENSKRLQEQLDKIADKGARIQDPFEQSLFLLIHISYLQAFADVNKRTARLSANIPLIRENLVPLAFSDVEIKDYMSAMIAIYELQDVKPIIDLYKYSYLRTCMAYDSTLKALGFDEVRVRYRQVRREVLREIILGKMVGTKLKAYIKNKTEQLIPAKDQKNFKEDLREDLEQLDQSRIFGLGVTVEELDEWLRLN